MWTNSHHPPVDVGQKASVVALSPAPMSGTKATSTQIEDSPINLGRIEESPIPEIRDQSDSPLLGQEDGSNDEPPFLVDSDSEDDEDFPKLTMTSIVPRDRPSIVDASPVPMSNTRDRSTLVDTSPVPMSGTRDSPFAVDLSPSPMIVTGAYP